MSIKYNLILDKIENIAEILDNFFVIVASNLNIL